MQIEKLRSLIRESINEYIREIEEGGNIAALEAKELKCEEAIQMRQERLNKINENDDLKEMVDETKMKEIQNEIKLLEKAKKKYAAQKAKIQAKKDKKENPEKEEKVTTDTPIDEADVTAQMEMSDDKMKEEALNESFLKMQKLAGVITEAQYNSKKKALVEAIGDFNAPGFAASIKENLKKMGYEVTDMKGSSIDSAKGDLEKAANEGKNSAVVGVLEWEDGEEVVAAMSLNQKEKDGGMAQQKELKAKIHDLYAKDFTTRFNVGNNGRVLVIGIKDKEKTNEIFGFGSKPKFKDGDKVYIKVGGHDNSEWETEPRKISISRQKPYKDKRGMMYRVTTNPDKQGNFFTSGGLDVPEQNIKLA